jgi:hypothetical protein
MAKGLRGEKPQIRLISKRSEGYILEFINGAISNLTPRGEIVCDFHLESRDRPTEQFVESVTEDGTAKLSPFVDTGIFTRDVKFGIVINVPFAKDLVKMLNDKISEAENKDTDTDKTIEGVSK